jgi:signal recognition particle GTPase
MESINLYLKPLDKNNETQQFIQTVLSSVKNNPSKYYEDDICDEIEKYLIENNISYQRELYVLAEYRKRPVLHDGKIYSIAVSDFYINNYLIEVKCKDDLSTSDKRQLHWLSTCKGIDGVVLAHYNELGNLINCALFNYCQSRVYYGKFSTISQNNKS